MWLSARLHYAKRFFFIVVALCFHKPQIRKVVYSAEIGLSFDFPSLIGRSLTCRLVSYCLLGQVLHVWWFRSWMERYICFAISAAEVTDILFFGMKKPGDILFFGTKKPDGILFFGEKKLIFRTYETMAILFYGRKKPFIVYFSTICHHWIESYNLHCVAFVFLPCIWWPITEYCQFHSSVCLKIATAGSGGYTQIYAFSDQGQ